MSSYLKLEIADTPSKQQYGLMHRKSLNKDSGMLFVFAKSQILNFWGMNTYIPLDIAFVREDNTISKISQILPFDTKKTASSPDACKMAIETNINFFKENNIKDGDKVDIQKLSNNLCIVRFKNASNTR